MQMLRDKIVNFDIGMFEQNVRPPPSCKQKLSFAWKNYDCAVTLSCTTFALSVFICDFHVLAHSVDAVRRGMAYSAVAAGDCLPGDAAT